MNTITIIVICLIFIILVGGIVLLKVLMPPAKDNRIHALTAKGIQPVNAAIKNQPLQEGLQSRSRVVKREEAQDSKVRTVNPKDKNVLLFQAGFFSEEEKDAFSKKCKIAYIVCIPLFAVVCFMLMGTMGIMIGIPAGIIAARIYPDRVMSKRITERQDESSYYLPLVVEQLGIGVSSGLDIGPCVAYVVEMANERGSNNVITELLGNVMKLTKAGMSLEEGLLEIGAICGYPPTKNAFGFLAQCAKHGGEVSKQLMELSESVSDERRAIIEAKINALPNKATGVLGMIFGGFFIIIVTSIFSKIYLSM